MSDRQQRTKQTGRKPNRAQRKAQQVRLAETNAPAPIEVLAVEEVAQPPSEVVAAPVRSSRRTARQRAQPATYSISRETEYAYIESDLRRLILTAGALLILMFALLFLLD